MNAGIQAAEAQFIHFNNSGDRLLFVPDNLVPHRMNFFAVDVVSMAGDAMTRSPSNRKYLMPHHQGTFIPRSIYLKQFFNEKFHLAADLDFYLRTQASCDVRHEIVVSRFFIGGASTLSVNRWRRFCERCVIIFNNQYFLPYLRYLLQKPFCRRRKN